MEWPWGLTVSRELSSVGPGRPATLTYLAGQKRPHKHRARPSLRAVLAFCISREEKGSADKFANSPK